MDFGSRVASGPKGSHVVVDIGTILSAGRPMSLDESVDVPAFAAFRFPRPAHVALELRRIDRGLQIDGIVEVEAAGECDRCLEDALVPLQIEVDERFDPPSGTSDPFGENNVLNGTQLDIGDLIRQVVTT
jgi:uncharacterized metal-binding protein YceD (DUF177 family)